MPKIPGISHQDAVRALHKIGFEIKGQGKYIVMSDGTHIITVPWANPINAYTMGGIARDAGLTVEKCTPYLAYGVSLIRPIALVGWY